jgi:hypothetical protein
MAYTKAEDEAQATKRGLWADPAPVAPWEYRHPDAAETKAETGGKIIGNRNSMIYHRADCPDYAKVGERNRVLFDSEQDAVKAGYRKARNCP